MRCDICAWAGWLLLAVGVGVSARGDVGNWNDASRLATAEAIVDHGTLRIDDTLFEPRTWDKVRIQGRFYSDKPPVPSLWLAGWYWLLQKTLGITARDDPWWFCWSMTFCGSGLAFLLATWAMRVLARRLGLRPWPGLLVAASFALGTLAIVYTRHVNNHIMLLAVAAWLLVVMAKPSPLSCGDSWLTGLLAGLAYAVDVGAGMIVLLGAGAYVAWGSRSLRACAAFVLGVGMFVGLHHALNYAIAGGIRPVATVPEYFDYPGSSFSARNLTGGWLHDSIGSALVYGASLIVGRAGFLFNQPVLWLAILAFGFLLAQRPDEAALLCVSGLWCVGTWALYAAASNNHGGGCCSIRWFLPLLAPCYVVIALAVRTWPSLWQDLCVLSAWGAVVMAWSWPVGPWTNTDPVVAAFGQAGALASWCAMRLLGRR